MVGKRRLKLRTNLQARSEERNGRKMTNVMATKWQNDQHTGGKVTNEMTNVGTAGEWKWQTKWQEKETKTMAEIDKRRGGKMRMQCGKMTNVMWGKSNERSAGKWQTKWQESNECNNGKMRNVMALKWTQSAGKPRKSLGYEWDNLFNLFRIARAS